MSEEIKQKHYVYRITNILKHRYYIGKRSIPKKFKNRKPEEDLGHYYFSSSGNKGFVRNQKLYPDQFKYKIIKVFDNEDDALNFEIKLHSRLNVQAHRLFYNNANQTKNGFFRDTKRP